MTKNIGIVDRAVRIIVGLVCIAYALQLGFSDTGWNWTGWIGVPLIITALIRSCPAYSLFGISTTKS